MGVFGGTPYLPERLLDAVLPDARSTLLWRRVQSTDTAYLRKRYGSDVSPEPAVFRKELEFEYAFVQAGGLLLPRAHPTRPGGGAPGLPRPPRPRPPVGGRVT